MADFVPSQKYASDFNKAKKYENGDAVQAETVNNLIEGQLFVQGIATNQPKVVEDNTEGSPTVYFENKDGLPRFVFKNIRGKDGKMGKKGDNGNIMRFTDSALYARSDVGALLTIGSGNLINGQNVAVGDVVLDIHYQKGENYYICIWEVINVSSSNAIELRGMDYISSTGGGGTVKIEVDNELSTTSEKPVQNKVITKKINDINSELTEHDNTLEDLDIRVGAVEEEVDERAKTIEYSWESIGADGVNPFKLNLTLKDANGNQLSTTQIDFPLEQMVIDAEYDKVNKQLILKLPDTQLPVPVADIFEGLATKTELDATNKTVNNLSTEVSGYSQRITDAEANIGQLQDEKLDKSGGIIYNPNSTTDAPLHIRANNQACYLGFRNNTGEAVGFYGFSASNVPQVAIANVGVLDLIHSNNIGSQHVAIADELECHYDTTIAIDNPDGHLRYSSNVPSSATGIFPCVNNANAILTISKHGGNFDSQLGFSSNGNMYYRSFNDEAMNNTKPWKTIVDSDNFETYMQNYLNKYILEKGY